MVELVKNRDPCGITVLRCVGSWLKSREIKRDFTILCDAFPFVVKGDSSLREDVHVQDCAG
jgi:hypothetical protein